METLEKKASEASDRFDENAVKLKKLQGKLNDLKELKMHIINYSRTKETYVQYRKKGYSKKFFEEHREELQLHKAAKEYFNAQHFKKLPKMKELSDEYGQILAEKKKEYAEYKEAKTSMQDFLIARQNIEAILGAEEKEREEKKREEKQK